MVHLITRTALDELIANGSVHDCSEGYGNYVVAVTTARFDKGLTGEIYLEKWYEAEYYANRMASHFEDDNLCPGWDAAWEVEVWYVMDDTIYDVDKVWDPERPNGRVYLVTFEDGDGEVVSSVYRRNFFTAIKMAQRAVAWEDDVQVAVINDFLTGMVFRVDKSLCRDVRLYQKFSQEKREVENTIESLCQLRLAAELAVI